LPEFITPRLEKLHSQPEAQKLLLALKNRGGVQTFLWTGPKGVGKKTYALALARTLFCRQGVDCPGCPDCRQVLSKSHPDLYWVDREYFFDEKDREKKTEGIFVDTSKLLAQKLAQAPFSAPLKIAVIPDAGKMNDKAQEVLLKTLEEPSGDTLIILIEEKKGDLLPTVLSRCRPVRFSALPDKVLESLLVEGHGWEVSEAKKAAINAQGSLTLALREADPEWREFRDKVEKDLELVLSGPEEGWLALSSEYDQWEPEILDDTDRTATQRKTQVLALVFEAWTNLWRKRVGGAEPLPPKWGALPPMDVLQSLSRHQEMIFSNLQARMILDHLFMELRDGAQKGEINHRPLTELTL
jgi:DNA polymerase-3 subunit delta'